MEIRVFYLFIGCGTLISLCAPLSAQTTESGERPPAATTATAPMPVAQQIEENLLLLRGNNTPEARKLGAAKLLQLGTPESIRPLIDLLSTPGGDAAAQLAIASAVGDAERPPTDLLNPLIELLADPRPALGQAAARAIQRFESEWVIRRLKPMATNSRGRPAERFAAISALGLFGDNIQAIAVLAALLENDDPAIRVAALEAFAQATGVGAEDPRAALTWWRRVSVMSKDQWLKALIEARSAQVRALQDSNAELTRRLVAAQREKYLLTPEAQRGALLQAMLRDNLAAVRLLGLDVVNDLITDRKEVGPDTRAIIVERVTDDNARVRLRAALRVGDLRLTMALPRLMEAIAQETNIEARAAQTSALGRIDDPAAAPLLEERLLDDSLEVVGEAALALGTLARRGQANPDVAARAAPALLARYQTLPPDRAGVREKFLTAMATVADESFRPVFEAEMQPDRPVNLQRAAIAGLAAYGDARAAEQIRPLLRSPTMEVRLAAVDALGKCGRSRKDLDALAMQSQPDRETEVGIRQRAWDGFLAVAQRIGPDEVMQIAQEFDRPDDPAAQRRRLELLRAVRSDLVRFDALPHATRIGLIEQMADAQMDLEEYAGAAASWEQVVGLLDDDDTAREAEYYRRAVSALLKAREDAEAVRRIEELTDGESVNGETVEPARLVDSVRQEINARITVAETRGVGFAEAVRLIELSGEPVRRLEPDAEAEWAAARQNVEARRDAVIESLLDAIVSDPQAEERLFQLGRDAVLPKIHQRLVARSATSAPADESEARLVRLARRLLPTWTGFNGGSTADDRAAALEALRTAIEGARSEAPAQD